MITYKAVDKGEKKYLKGILCPQTLHLKRGCPVMLLRNLSNILVNGSMGRVVDFGNQGPIVNFMEAEKTLELTPMPFSSKLMCAMSMIFAFCNTQLVHLHHLSSMDIAKCMKNFMFVGDVWLKL
jgi:hypothetical protein